MCLQARKFWVLAGSTPQNVKCLMVPLEVLSNEVHRLVRLDHSEANGDMQSDIISCQDKTFRRTVWTLQSYFNKTFQQRWCAHVLQPLTFVIFLVTQSGMHIQKHNVLVMPHMVHLIVCQNQHGRKFSYAVCLPSLHEEDLGICEDIQTWFGNTNVHIYLVVLLLVVGKLCVHTADNQSQHIDMMMVYLSPESKLHMLVHPVCVTYFYALNPVHCTVFWLEKVTVLPSCHAIGYLRPQAQCHNGVPFLNFCLPLTLLVLIKNVIVVSSCRVSAYHSSWFACWYSKRGCYQILQLCYALFCILLDFLLWPWFCDLQQQ